MNDSSIADRLVVVMGDTDVLDQQHRDRVAGEAMAAPRGDRATERRLALRRLADQHLDRSYRLTAVVLGSGSEAQDAVHDAFVTAWYKYDSLRDRSSAHGVASGQGGGGAPARPGSRRTARL